MWMKVMNTMIPYSLSFDFLKMIGGGGSKDKYFVTCESYMEFTFVSVSVFGTQACPFTYVLSVAAFSAA